jgi:uncharacterized protein
MQASNELNSRFKKVLATTALTASLALSAAAPAAAQVSEPVNLTIASFVQGSSWYVYAVNLGELLRSELPEGSTIDTPPIAGGLANPQLIASDRADLAFGMAVVGSWALEGEVGYEQPMPELRALVGGWDNYWLVPMARGAGHPNNLSGFFSEVKPDAQVTLLQRGSIGSFGGEQLLDIAGAGEDAVAQGGGGYEFGTFEMVKSRFASGTGDVFVQVATLGHPGVTEIAQSTAVTFLQPSDETLKEMTERYGWGTRTLPSGSFPGQDQDVVLPSTTTTLFTSAEVSEDLAYTIVKTICENKEKLQDAHRALEDFDCADGVWEEEVNGLPLHPGAERYYRERGWLN